MRRTMIVMGVVVLLTASVSAEETLRDIYWTKLAEVGELTEGLTVATDEATGMEYVTVTNDGSVGKTVRVLSIDAPGVTRARYALRGKVRYTDVVGEGYLEMWNHFPDGSRCFTRTLSDGGALARLEGSSDWRFFSLPFTVTKGEARPVKLVVNVVLPGKGTVHLSALRLVQYAPSEHPAAAPGRWWSDRQAGFIGGLTGSVIGLIGAIVGILGGRGKARRFVLHTLKVLPIVGAAALGVAAVAVAKSQPYAVYYPLLLLGGLLVLIPLGVLPGIRKRYEVQELRKMEAQDA